MKKGKVVFHHGSTLEYPPEALKPPVPESHPQRFYSNWPGTEPVTESLKVSQVILIVGYIKRDSSFQQGSYSEYIATGPALCSFAVYQALC